VHFNYRKTFDAANDDIRSVAKSAIEEAMRSEVAVAKAARAFFGLTPA